jgi:hypothetical protein
MGFGVAGTEGEGAGVTVLTGFAASTAVLALGEASGVFSQEVAIAAVARAKRESRREWSFMAW